MRKLSHSPTRALCGLAVVAWFAFGCNGATNESPSPQTTSPIRGGTAAIGINSDIGGVNELITPAANITDDVLYKLFLRLWDEQPDFTKGPAEMTRSLVDDGPQAEVWDDARRTLSLRLRKATWSDGQPITAHDVRWTWQMQTHPAISWDGATAKRYIRDVEVVDNQNVRFHFDRTYPRQILDANEGVILPKHVWSQIPPEKWRENGDWFRDHLVTSGPFRLESWKPQAEVILARNDKYWDANRPRLDRVVMRVVPDQTAQLAQLLNGELDFITNLKVDDVPRIKTNPRLEVIAIDFRATIGIAWNNDDPLFKEAEVRRALTLAIDRSRMVQALWGPYARPTGSPILSFVWAHDKTLPLLPYDPAEAKRLLAKHGFADRDGDGIVEKDGRKFAFELLVNSGNQQRADAAVMVQSQLASVGIAATPRQIEATTLNDHVDQGKYQAAFVGLGMDTSFDFTSFLDSSSIGTANNFARYRNGDVDRLLREASVQPTIQATEPMLHAIERILDRDQPYTFLWESQRLSARNLRLRWDSVDRDGTPRQHGPTMVFTHFGLADWWLEPKSAN